MMWLREGIRVYSIILLTVLAARFFIKSSHKGFVTKVKNSFAAASLEITIIYLFNI